MNAPLVARFGFLPEPYTASWAGTDIRPLPDYDERRAWYEKYSNADGYFYPPQVDTYELRQNGTRKRKVPRTSRPAPLFRLPASHTVEIRSPVEETPPYSDSTLLLHVLAFIFGTRLQFEEWRFDGRVPTKSTLNAYVPDLVRSHFIEHAYAWWKTLPSETRERVINLFYAFNRASSAEWDWDAFYQQYMVFDGLFRLHADLNSLPSDGPHEGRFVTLCGAYGIPIDKTVVKPIYEARNDLFHEAMWAKAMIGYATPKQDASHYPRHLARLNSRVLCAITGYRNSYTCSVWWAMGSFLFDRPAT